MSDLEIRTTLAYKISEYLREAHDCFLRVDDENDRLCMGYDILDAIERCGVLLYENKKIDEINLTSVQIKCMVKEMTNQYGLDGVVIFPLGRLETFLNEKYNS